MLLRLLNLQDRSSVRYTGVTWRGDAPTMVVDISKAIRLLAFSSEVPFEVGIARLIKWLRREQGYAFGNP